ncbi:hypothetical protein NDU88_004012 [Pleurodeles waltl]|uniref:Uncharacterized protein n=1 Tax=Pleurodeles waltl TaxID=8319 RepID=A0AAV7UE81_PLEWA|nr:hypothetical protein NDU88_004012 [Pleurodeles waltl]
MIRRLKGTRMTLVTLWKALKATVRGDRISHISRRRKKSCQDMTDLEKHILELEAAHASSGSHTALRDSLPQQKVFYQLLVDEAEWPGLLHRVAATSGAIKPVKFCAGAVPTRNIAHSLQT